MSDVPSGHRALCERAAERIGRSANDVLRVEGGILNDVYRVVTPTGDLCVRIHREARDRARLEAEQRIMAWASATGLPVPAPLAGPDGETLVRDRGRFVSTFEWVDGYHARRGEMSPAEAETLGEMLGRLHSALAGYADTGLPSAIAGFTWSAQVSIDELYRVDDIVRYVPSPDAEYLRAQELLRRQVALIERFGEPAERYADVKLQPCHGDYHHRNVLLANERRVAAVVDWELARLLPPAFEVAKAVSWMGLMENSRAVRSFGGGYRRFRSMTRDEARRGVDMWWQHVLHNTWAFRARFIEGNDAAGAFLERNDADLHRLAERVFRGELVDQLLSG